MKVEFVKRQVGCSHAYAVFKFEDGGEIEAEVRGVYDETIVEMVIARLRKEFEEQFMPRPAKPLSVAEAVKMGLIATRSMPLSIREAVEMNIIHEPVAALDKPAEAVATSEPAWYVRAWRCVARFFGRLFRW